MGKRVFDIAFSIIGIVILMPVFIIVSLFIKIDSTGPIFYRQRRVGLNFKEFDLIKFRSMGNGSDKSGLLTVGDHDSRITRMGFWLRKYKIDELPQLVNILKSDMSFVGPRPEVSKYVKLYTSSQRRVLTVKPGITDWASLYFMNESELLAKAESPENFYVSTIIPSKVKHNLEYIDHNNLWIDMKIILLTCLKIVSGGRHLEGIGH